MHSTYLALCSRNEPFLEHKMAQQQTWAKNRADIYWLLGDGPINNQVVLDGEFLLVGVPDIFANILEKTINSLRWCLENDNSDFYIRTNTSTYIETSRVGKLIAQLNPLEHYAAGAFGISRIGSNYSPAGETFIAGNMMIFSRKTVQTISTMEPSEYQGIPDDVAISLFLRENGISFNEIRRNDLTDFKGFRPCIQHRVKSWTDFKVTSDRMQNIHQYYTSKGLPKFKAVFKIAFLELSRYRKEFPLNSGRNLLRNFKNSLRNLYSFIITILSLRIEP